MRGPVHPLVNEHGVGPHLVRGNHRLERVRLIISARSHYQTWLVTRGKTCGVHRQTHQLQTPPTTNPPQRQTHPTTNPSQRQSTPRQIHPTTFFLIFFYPKNVTIKSCCTLPTIYIWKNVTHYFIKLNFHHLISLCIFLHSS